MSGIGRLIDNPELRFTPGGTEVCSVRLAFNSRKKTEAGEWVDGDVFYINGVTFGEIGERISESLTKGTEVVVTGRLKTRQYTTKEGEKRSVVELLIDSIGPSLKFVNVRVMKLDRKHGDAVADDGWAAPATADDMRAAVGTSDEAPF